MSVLLQGEITYKKLQTKDLNRSNYNRNVSMDRVRKMVAKYNSKLVGNLIVNYRDGQYYVIDGQHRLAMLKTKGIHEVICCVYVGLTYKEEAILFKELGSSSKPIKTIEGFIALVEAGDHDACDIKNIIELIGFKISPATADNRVSAVSALSYIYQNIGPDGLKRVLKIIKSTWHGIKESLNQEVLMGMYFFIKCYYDDVSDIEIIKKLDSIDPVVLTREGKLISSHKGTGCARRILYYYNFNRSTKKLSNKFRDLD